MARSYTRRALLKRGGLLGGAAWLAATGWEKTVGRAVAALTTDAVERTRRTYVALVDAASSSPTCLLRSGRSTDEIRARFDGWYSKQDDRLQRITDSIFADLDSSFGGGFHKATRSRRLDHLHALAGPPVDTKPASRADFDVHTNDARRAEIARYANDPAYRADPMDISSMKPVPLAHPNPAIPEVDVARTQRYTLLETALKLAAAPDFLPQDDPSSLVKVPEVTL